MRLPAIALWMGLITVTPFAADILTIDAFEYADQAAAGQAWKAAERSDPPDVMAHESEGGKTALKLPCPFTRPEVNRACYDRDVALDLTRYGSIVFDFYADDTLPISGCTIYFHAGDGWYAGSFSVRQGWQRITLGRGAFRTEDQPGGWDKVDRIRLSVWKSLPKDTWCAIDNLHARSEDLVIVRGTPEGGEGGAAQQVAERLHEFCADLGVPTSVLTDEDVEHGALGASKVALFGYSPTLSEEAIAEIEKFIAAGGKVVIFYSIPSRLAELLGVGGLTYRRAERDGQFADVVLAPDVVVGMPEKIVQNSWNVNLVTPTGQNARAAGTWQDAQGQPQGTALVVSDTGAYMGHILTGGDEEAKRAFVLALIGHFLPAAWETATQHALSAATRIGPFESRTDLEAYLRAKAPGAPYEAEVAAKLAVAAEAEQQARALLAQQRYPAAMAQASAMRQALSDAYIVAHTPRDGEFRAVWNHSGTGDCGTWDEAMKHLAAANFNAVVPNMWWGGVAHYDSALLPHSQTFREKGDQIAQCVAAGKKYGIQVHPWKVNWNCEWTAPEDFVAQMRAAGRLQATHTGQEIKWLCPSHPDNFKLELETMLEVVRNYDVDGVHFDYIRYPHGDSCYCNGCRERFEQAIGKQVENWPDDCYSGPLRQQYREWRCDQITRLVRATAEEARRIKPHIKISAAVFSDYPGCKDSVGQDWVLWCKQGWLDFVCPMNYTASDHDLRNKVARQVGLVGGAVPLYCGIGQFIIPDDQVVGQIEIARAQGADGFILFNMGASLAQQTLPKLVKGITSQPAVLPHDAPVVDFSTPEDDDEPIVKIEADSLKVEVQLLSYGNHRAVATGATGVIELQDLDGERLVEVGPLPAVTQKVSFEVPRRAEAFRFAAVGQLAFQDGTARRFILRSRPYQFVAAQ